MMRKIILGLDKGYKHMAGVWFLRDEILYHSIAI